jgi:hypothetical protein
MKTFLPKTGIFTVVFLIASLFFVNSAFGQITQITGSPQTANTTSATLTITKPSGLAVGDVMFANILQTENDNSTGGELSNASRTGWTPVIDGRQIGVGAGGSGDEWYGTLLYKVADATDVAATNFAFTLDSDANGDDGSVGTIVAFRGVDVTGGVKADGTASGPFDLDPGIINSIANDATFTATLITSITNDAAIIMFGLQTDNQTISNWRLNGVAGSLTQLYDNQLNTSGMDMGIGAAWAIKSVAGSTGTGTADLANNSSNGGILIALKRLMPTITTGSIVGSPFCAGTAVTVPYTITGTFTAGNIFTAQLSDSSGSFASPIPIGTNTSISAGSITATIPNGQVSGTGYRIRVVSSMPSVTSLDNGSDLIINALPTANAGAVLSAICQGGTSASLGGSVGGSATGGTWSDGGLGGTFNPSDTDLNATWTPAPGYSGTALLTLTSSGGACGTTTASKSQTVDAQPTAAAGGSQTICANQTAIISGTATNGTIVWTVGGGVATGTLDNPNIESPVFTPDQFFEGTATLTMTVSNGVCTPAAATYTVIVSGGAATVDQGADVTVCMSTPEQVPLSGIVGGGASSGTWSGGNGQFLPNNTDLASSYTPTQLEIDSGSVILTLTSEDPGGSCPGALAKSRTITFKKAPTATAGGNIGICPGGSAMVNGASSSNGTIVWTHDGSGSLSNADTLTPTYTSVAGDAGNTITLTLTVSNSPCPDATATYTVVVNPLPINRSLLGTGPICSGSGTNIQVIDSEYEDNFGINYQLRNNVGNVLVGAPVAGTGSTIDLPTGNLTNTTTFNVLATNMTTSCFVQMSGTITITVNPAPVDRTVGPTTPPNICSGSTTNITVAASTNTTTTYQLRNNSDNSLVGLPVTGNGGTISLPTGPLTNITSAPIVITYNVLATITATGCTAQMAITKAVTVNPAISNNIISADQSICSGATPATLTGVPSGGNGTYTYGWFQSTDNFVGNNNNASTANGSRTAQDYSPPSLTQSMWYRRTVTSDACATDTSPAVKITVNPLPTVFTVTGGGAYCDGGAGMPIGLSNSQANINYQLFLGATPDGSPVVGTGAAISFGNKTAPGTYTVVATDTAFITNCSSNMTGSATITVNPVPVTVGASVCLGDSGVLTSSTVCALGAPINTGSADKNAGLGINIPIGFNMDWTNPGNIVGAGNATATNIGAGSDTDYLRGTNYDFSAIPANAEIKGIQVRINRMGSSTTLGGVSDIALFLVKDVSGLPVIQDTGDNKAKTTTWPTTLTIDTYGSATDLWNLSWTVNDIKNANFGVALAAHNNSGLATRTANVDYMQITVYYSVNGVIEWYTAPSGGTYIGTGSSVNPVNVLNPGFNTNTPGTTTFYAICTSVPTCPAATNFVVLPLPTVNASATNVSCNGLADGTITVSGVSVGATTTIQLDGAGPDLSAQTTFAPGTYLITASTPNGSEFCTSTASVTITEPIAVTVNASATNVSCNGLADGTITVSGVSVGATTMIQLDGAGPDLSAQTTFAPGTYLITATAPNGNADGFCTATASVTITEPVVVTVNASATNVSCNGLADGIITISGLSAGATTTIQLDGAGPDLSAQTTFAPGTYLITATAPNGNADGFCTTTASVTITEPIVITVSASATNVSCNGLTDGTITVSGLSAGATTIIQLDGAGADLSAQTTFAPGTYLITATAPNGNADGFCTTTASVTITEPIVVTVSASATNVSCNGAADGTITISGLSAGATTIIQLDGAGPDLSAQTTFAPGTYLITATAPNGNADGFCTATASVTITEPIVITVSASATNVSCNGLADGIITISGLSAGATTIIQLDGTGPDLSAQSTFAPGTYLITASAPNGNADGFCTATASVTITEPIAVTVSASATNPVCNGSAPGTITISGVSAGATTMIQLDGVGPDLSAQTTFAPGTYLITATAPNGNADGFCTTTASVTITEPIAVTVNASATNVSCNGLADGTITISGLSAGATTTIQLDGAGPDLSAQTTFAPGTYLITATAPNGNADGFCTATASVTITEPIVVTVNASATNVSCNGAADGTITISGLSAGATSIIQLDGAGLDLSAQTIFAPGTYLITASAPNGNADGFCTATASVTITEPIVVTVNASATNVSCNGAADGTITISGLSAGASTIIQLDGAGPDLSAQTTFAPGTYLITATAPNGNADGFCTTTASVTITEPIVVTVSASATNVSCNGLADGTITISGLSAGATTTIQLDGTGPDLSAQTTFAPGTYLITATAPNGNADGFCTATASVTITEPIAVTVNASATNVSCNGSAPGTIIISGVSAGATTMIQLDGAGPDLSAQTTFALGTYLITATAPNGNADGFCTATASVTITEPIAVTVNASATNVSCNGAADGTITISGVSAGATTIIQLDGSGPDLSAQTTFAPGTYLITASAPNGNADGFCTATASVTITEPTVLTASITAQTNVDCFGNSNGSATVSATGGTIEYTYLWDDPLAQTNAAAINLAADTYHVIVTDDQGCTATATATIIIDDNELPTVITQNIDAELNPTSLSITASQINNGSHDNCAIQSMSVSPNSFTCANVGPNLVTLTVTDTNGNINTGTATVTVKDLILPVISGMPVNKTVNLSGGNCSALVGWTAPTATDNCGMASLLSSDDTYNENGNTLLGIGVHTITYTATDVNGNIATASFTVTVVDHSAPTITNCPGNITVNTDNNICGARIFYVQPNVNDCNGASLTINNNNYLSGNIFPLGTTVVTWTATDASNNLTSCSFNVTVEDHQAPIANVASLPTVTGECLVTVPTPTALDNCDGTINGIPDGPTTYSATGTYTIVWTYTDSHGNNSSQNQTVNVSATPPVINTQPVSLNKCEGQSATFSVSSPAIGYQWQVNTGSGWNDLGSETNSTLNIASVTTGMNGNNYRVIVNGSCGSIPSDEVTLTVYSLPIASNQLDQVLCNSSTFNMTQSGSGTWTLISGTATITTPSSPTTTITGVAAGTSVTLRWTVTNGPCSAYDEVTVTNTVLPSVSDQVNQTLCNTSSFTMTQSVPSIGTGIWTLVSGSATITTPDSPNTTITGVAAGESATIKWTVTNGSCSAFDEVTIMNAILPLVSDQANQNLCNTSSFTMTQSVPSIGTGTWTLISGIATITTASSPTTTITGVAVGTSAKVKWTVTSGSCSSFDEVIVTNTILPSVSDQPNQTLCNTSSFTMTQSVPSAGTGTWTLISGSAAITTPSSPTSTITGVAVGTSATVRWTVSNIDCSTFDEVTVTNSSLSSVSDQPNQNLCNTSSFTMTQSGSGTWTLINGSAGITAPNSPTTTITGVAVGSSVTVRWTVGSGACSVFDDVTVTNTTLPTVSDQPNQTLCNTSSFAMTQSGSGTWTLISGSAGITAPNSPTTTITGVGVGSSATVRWTVGSGACTTFDEVTVTNTVSPTVSNQPNQTLCNTSSFSMTQSGSGTWTLISGSAGITTPNSPTTTITGVAVGSSATVRWTVGSGACTAFDEVTVTNNAAAPFTASIAASSPNAFCSGLTLTANPSVAGSYSYLWSPGGATTQSITLYNSASVGTYTVTITKTGSCSNTAQANYNFQPQNIINDYTILGFSDVNLGDRNFVQTGSVGVTKPLGFAKIGTNSTVAGPGGFVKARFITVLSMSNVPVRIYSPATVVLPTMQVNSSSTTGLSDLNIPNNTTVTKTGNYKNVSIGTNCNVTFTTGTIFGSINIGKSSQVKFNANSTGVLNVNSINLADGTDAAPSKLLFASDISIRVKSNVTIGKSSLVNTTGGYKAVFFVGGNEFRVLPGGNVTVNASVFAPNGTIKVDGDAAAVKNTYMKGFYIGSRVASTNKNIYWNQFDCLNPTAKTNDVESIATKEAEPLVSPKPAIFDVKAYPNPTNYQFTIEVEGGNAEKVEVDLFDMQGRSIKHIESTNNQSIIFGEDLPAGTYIAVVNQGANRKTLKLIKK